MPPEDNPIDEKQSFPCPVCERGEVTETDGRWCCDSCDWSG